MANQYAEGYTTEAEYCPFCGGQVSTIHSDGSCTCDNCGRRFFIIDAD